MTRMISTHRFPIVYASCVTIAVRLASAQTALPEFPKHVTTSCRALLEDGKKRLEAGDKAQALRRFELFELKKPMPVFINVSAAPKNLRASYREAALAGLKSWNDACPEIVEFRATDNEDEAPIYIVFETSVANQNNNQLRLVCGETHAFAENDAQRNPARWKAEVRIAIYPHGRNGHLHAAVNVTHVVAHELGHFLCFEDNPAPEDIMSPDEHNKPCSIKPSDNEVKLYRAFRETLGRWVEAAKK